MSTEIKVPTLGESVTEATIGQWFKKPGDRVEMDETLAELETDKVTVEVPAPAAGVLQDIAVPEGIEIKTPDQTTVEISGIDKQKVGQLAAEIRRWRKPEPYKGKGIKYRGEYIFRKEGKKK